MVKILDSIRNFGYCYQIPSSLALITACLPSLKTNSISLPLFMFSQSTREDSTLRAPKTRFYCVIYLLSRAEASC